MFSMMHLLLIHPSIKKLSFLGGGNKLFFQLISLLLLSVFYDTQVYFAAILPAMILIALKRSLYQ